MASAEQAAPAAIVGVDVGGTFTDLVLLDPVSGTLRIAKLLTTPGNQAEGVLAALAACGIAPTAIAGISHATTATTNALIERKLARTGLITTQGFRDVLELGRRTRPQPYGLIGHFEPLIPRQLRLEVPERMAADGTVITPLDEAAVRAAARHLRAQGCESLVIHFLHSYHNPEHERRAAEIARAEWPNRHITCGHAILAEFREYERGVAAAVNALVQPVLERYLTRLQSELTRQGFARDLLLMQGNGGSIAARNAPERAVLSVRSGPASGVTAAAALASALHLPRLISYDMGGTSTDVGLVLDGLPSVSAEIELEYAMPIHVPMVDVHSIGAGGGSIAVIDTAGLLRVGPESAGADPGPICYGRGGARPTITDANLVLGRLDPKRLLSVTRAAEPTAIARQIEAMIGRPLGLGGVDAAAAILRIANDKMAGAIRMVSLARGHDPRDFVLLAFGGAGPLHASALARELGIPRVLVPARPGLTNAIGCAIADLRRDLVQGINRRLDALAHDDIGKVLARQSTEGRAALLRDGVALEKIAFRHFAGLQFEGQTHILTIPLEEAALTPDVLRAEFAAAYHERFAVELPEIRAILVNLHTVAIGQRPSLPLALFAERTPAATLEDAQRDRRAVWYAQGWRETPIYDRHRLPNDVVIEGPAIIAQLDCTTVIEPGDRATLDALGNLMIEVGQ